MKAPLVFRSQTIWYDVDDTLVFWNVPPDYQGPTVTIKEHNSFHNVEICKTVAINTAMVDNLKGNSDIGCHIVVWSQGGSQWAEAVVRALGLAEYVDVITDKPTVIYDDLPPSAWMPYPKHKTPPDWAMKLYGVYYIGSDEEE